MTTSTVRPHHPPAPSRPVDPAGGGWRARIPGLAAAAGVAIAAHLAGSHLALLGAPVLAVVAGMGAATAWGRHRPPRLTLGLRLASARGLQLSIVLLGTGLSLGQLRATGWSSAPVLAVTLATGLGVAVLGGRLLRLPRDLVTLIGVGTSICGASAIAAVDGVIGADPGDLSYAIATIFSFNVAAVVAYPPLGHLLGMTQQAFGVWSGTAVNDTSSVVATASAYGHRALATGLTVKLTRTLAIVPVCGCLASLRARRPASTDPAAAGPSPADAATPARVARRTFPGFLVWFLVAAAVNSAGLLTPRVHAVLAATASWLVLVALAAIGLSSDLRTLRSSGARPFALGATVWVAVSLSSLAAQAITHLR